MANGIIEGEGTSLLPYLIEDSEDVLNVASVDGTGAYFELTQDIDMGGITLTDENLLSFSGSGIPASLNGRGHSISNYSLVFLTKDDSGSLPKDYLPNHVTSLGLNINSLESAFNRVGVFLSSTRDTYFDSCYATSNLIKGKSMVGGFVGEYINRDISNCYSISKEIIGEQQVGGFLGYTEGHPTITNSYSYSEFISGERHVGGFGGRLVNAKCFDIFAFSKVIHRESSSSRSEFGAFAGSVFDLTGDVYSNSDIEFVEG